MRADELKLKDLFVIWAHIRDIRNVDRRHPCFCTLNARAQAKTQQPCHFGLKCQVAKRGKNSHGTL